MTDNLIANDAPMVTVDPVDPRLDRMEMATEMLKKRLAVIMLSKTSPPKSASTKEPN